MTDTTLILANSVVAGIKLLVPRFAAVMDSILPEAEVRIEVLGSDYSMKRVPFLWLWRHEEGSRFHLLIQGKPGFCESAVICLTAGIDLVDTVGAPPMVEKTVADEMSKRSKAERIADLFRFKNQLFVEIAGSGHSRESRFIFWEHEEGAALRLTVRGKPGFCRAVVTRLSQNAPSLRRVLMAVPRT